ncbi:hypothetical protein H5410_062799 [Solanum commersonii]|uniref:Uncharacterized protein n=1 Tax=Solanum commersonii TaxID=4109 RepID=A0A9J5WBM6_SOLCO|nr:hypothetical protein H5410_062799 [Solanum commersonii]
MDILAGKLAEIITFDSSKTELLSYFSWKRRGRSGNLGRFFSGYFANSPHIVVVATVFAVASGSGSRPTVDAGSSSRTNVASASRSTACGSTGLKKNDGLLIIDIRAHRDISKI